MPEKELSTLTTVSNEIYELSNRFINTFIGQFERYKANILALEDTLKANGYEDVNDAIADIPNHVTGDDAVAMEKNFTKAKEIAVTLNVYDQGASVVERMGALKTAVQKVYSVIGDLSRV